MSKALKVIERLERVNKLEDFIRAEAQALQQFGYHNVTDREVRVSIQAIKEGKEVVGIIGMFVKGHLEDAN